MGIIESRLQNSSRLIQPPAGAISGMRDLGMGISKYEMSAMEYLLRYGKDGKKLERKRSVWRIVWVIANLSILSAIVFALVKIVR
jgi:hypothetical protein